MRGRWGEVRVHCTTSWLSCFRRQPSHNPRACGPQQSHQGKDMAFLRPMTTLKGFRICHLKMCLFDILRILSWKYLRRSRYRWGPLIFFFCLKAWHKISRDEDAHPAPGREHAHHQRLVYSQTYWINLWLPLVPPYIFYHRLPWWLRQQRICLQCRRPGYDPWVGKIPWRRKWQVYSSIIACENPMNRRA